MGVRHGKEFGRKGEESKIMGIHRSDRTELTIDERLLSRPTAACNARCRAVVRLRCA